MDRETPKHYKRSICGDVEEIEEDDSHQSQPKRTCPSFLNGLEAESGTLAEVFSAEQVAILKSLIRSLVHEVVEDQVYSYTRSILSENTQLNNQIGIESVVELETSKYKLFFLNQTASTIFTSNEIEAHNGEPLLVAICDTPNSNAIIKTGPLSSALVEFVVLDGEFGSKQSTGEFNENIVSRREGKRPLIIGNEMMFHLKNGVGYIKGLSFSDNSSWTRSKKFKLGVKIVDTKILDEFSRIGEAVSEPFRVMDHRGEMYKKHHPPSREDEVWRLEGIGKNGIYHNRLTFKDIKTVGDFLKVYHKKGPAYLKMVLGEKVSQITWKKMINNALECDALVRNEAMGGTGALNENLKVGDHHGQKNFNDASNGLSHESFSDHEFEKFFGGNYEAMGGGAFEKMKELQGYNFIFDGNADYPPLVLLNDEASTSYNHELEDASTYKHYYQQKAWDVLEPKSK